MKRQQNMCSGTELSHPQIFNANIQTFRMRCGIPEPSDKAVVIKRQLPATMRSFCPIHSLFSVLVSKLQPFAQKHPPQNATHPTYLHHKH